MSYTHFRRRFPSIADTARTGDRRPAKKRLSLRELLNMVKYLTIFFICAGWLAGAAGGMFVPPAASSARFSAGGELAKTVSIAAFGAVGDGVTLNTKAIQSAIEQLAANGGGTVIIPRGVFLSGAIFLRPGVNLHLEQDAVLKGSTDMTNYPLRRIRIEGHFEASYSSGLINAEGCDGLRITGTGTLDGSGRPIWDEFWKRRRAADDYKNFQNLSLRRAQLCIINHSTNVVVDGVTFKDSQYWNLHLYDCRNVTVRNARFEVPDDYPQAPSTDGIDVDSCQDVMVNDCYFSVTDDCIALKGAKGPEALNDRDSPPVEHVRISGCTFRRGGGVTLGSEATIVRDVVVENCRFTGQTPVVNFKLRPDTPQRYEDIVYRNITLAGTGAILRVQPWTQYFDLHGQPPPNSVVRNVTLSDFTGSYGSFGTIQGNPGQTKLGDITLADIRVQLEQDTLKAVQVENFKLKNVLVNGKPFSLPVARPAARAAAENSVVKPTDSKSVRSESNDKAQG
jgi:alpha-L-rhamnosidase